MPAGSETNNNSFTGTKKTNTPENSSYGVIVKSGVWHI